MIQRRESMGIYGGRKIGRRDDYKQDERRIKKMTEERKKGMRRRRENVKMKMERVSERHKR